MEQFKVSSATVRQDCLDAGARLSLITDHSLSLSLAFYLFLPPSGFETVTKPESEKRDVSVGFVFF